MLELFLHIKYQLLITIKTKKLDMTDKKWYYLAIY